MIDGFDLTYADTRNRKSYALEAKTSNTGGTSTQNQSSSEGPCFIFDPLRILRNIGNAF